MTGNERRDSIAAYLRGRVTKWHEMATHFQAEGQLHVAERFGGASRLAYDAVLDIEADVDLRADAPVADPDMLVELARFTLADALVARASARGWNESVTHDLIAALGTRDLWDRWAASRGHTWRPPGLPPAGAGLKATAVEFTCNLRAQCSSAGRSVIWEEVEGSLRPCRGCDRPRALRRSADDGRTHRAAAHDRSRRPGPGDCAGTR